MNHTLVSFLLLLSISFASVPASAGETPGSPAGLQPRAEMRSSPDEDSTVVAVITSVHGSAALMRDSLLPASVGASLHRGDTLSVDNGSLSIVFMSGRFATITSGETLLLGSDLESCVLESSSGTRGPRLDGAASVPATSGSRPRRPDEWRRKLAYAAGVRGESGPVALSPRLTMADPHPVFVWFDPDSAAAGQARSYTVVLRDEHHRTLLKRSVSGRAYEHTRLVLDPLPEGFVADSGRRYSWDVFLPDASIPEGELDARCIYVDPAGLAAAASFRRQIDSLVSIAAVDTTSAAMMLAMRHLDDRERLFADAVPELLSLSRDRNARRWAIEQLVSIYLRFGNRSTVIAAILQREL